jgi:hypothetical protein
LGAGLRAFSPTVVRFWAKFLGRAPQSHRHSAKPARHRHHPKTPILYIENIFRSKIYRFFDI